MKIFNEDCFKVFPTLEDESIDMILCDLPYGTSACKWDTVLNFERLWQEYIRLIKPSGAVVLFGNEPFSSHLRLSCPPPITYKYDWKWIKNKGSNFLNAKFQPFKLNEDIMVFSKMASAHSKKGNMNYFPIMEKGAPYKNTWCSNRKGGISAVVASNFHPKENFAPKTVTERLPGNILYFDKPTNGFHPTEKPVPLLEYLIKTYTHEGDTVLDNCMGSGSTGVACLSTNRNFIGIELNKDYYETAEKRINNG